MASRKDEGYAWFVCLASFLGYLLVSMGQSTTGAFLHELTMSDDIDVSIKGVGWIISLQTSVGAVLGIFISPHVRHLGTRKASLIGALIGTSGYGGAVFAQNLFQLQVTMGFLVGLGNGYIFMSSAVSVQTYFNRKRALASALSTSGMSMAQFVVMPLVQLLLLQYGWRGTLLVMTGIYTHAFLISALMRPFQVPVIPLEEDALPQASSSLPRIPNGDESPAQSLTRHKENSTSTANGASGVHVSSARLSTSSVASQNNQFTNSKLTFPNYTPVVLNPEEAAKTNCCTVFIPLFTYIKESLDFSLLKKPAFAMFVAAMSLNVYGHLCMLFLLLSNAVQNAGFHELQASSLYTAIGGGTIVGRVVSGLVGDVSLLVDKRNLHMGIPMVLAGATNLACGFASSQIYLYVCCTLFGFCTGVYFVAQQPLLVRILGLENFPRSFGIMLVFTGTAALTGPPLAGWISDVFSSFPLAFLVCAGMQVLGGVLMVLIRLPSQDEHTKA